MTPLRIAVLSDAETLGGAAIAASRLAEAWACAGHEIFRLTSMIDQQQHPWHTINFPNHFGRTVPYRVARHTIGIPLLNLFHRPFAESSLRKIFRRIRPDVISVHNLHFADWHGFSVKMLEICMGEAPTVWTLHDMWSFTGRCACAYDCQKFHGGCDSKCPTTKEYPAWPRYLVASAYREKQDVLNRLANLVGVSPSAWLARQAKGGLWRNHTVRVIPNGLDLTAYRPLDRMASRNLLGLPSDGPVVLCQSDLDRQKGTRLMLEALPSILARPLTLLTLGRAVLDIPDSTLRVVNLGFVSDEYTKVAAFSASDLYIHPTLADNLPNMVMESISCGTPVVAFPIGGVPEMVFPGRTGYLAEATTSSALAEAINDALREWSNARSLSLTCRAHAEAEWDIRANASRYAALFETCAAGYHSSTKQPNQQLSA